MKVTVVVVVVITYGKVNLWKTQGMFSSTLWPPCEKLGRSTVTVNPRINAPGVYWYNRSEPPAFIRDPAFIGDPAFINSCCIGLLRKMNRRTQNFLKFKIDIITFMFFPATAILTRNVPASNMTYNLTYRNAGHSHLSK